MRSNAARWRAPGDAAQTLLTPAYLLEPIRSALGGIELDPCSLADNPTRAERWYYLPDRDGLAARWDARSIFVNPPYGEARRAFVRRAIEAGLAGSRVAVLIPAHTDTELVQAVLRGCHAATFVAGRVDFGSIRPDGRAWTATHPSLVAWWRADPPAGLGVTLEPRPELVLLP